jgi:hypothetical protein
MSLTYFPRFQMSNFYFYFIFLNFFISAVSFLEGDFIFISFFHQVEYYEIFGFIKIVFHI